MTDSWGRDVRGCKLDNLVPPLPPPMSSVCNRISRVSDCFPLNNQPLTIVHYSDVCEIWLCSSDQNMEHWVRRLVHPEEEQLISVSLPFSLISTMRKPSRSFIIACRCRDTCPTSFVTTWLHFYLETRPTEARFLDTSFSYNSYFLLRLQTIYLTILICYLIISTFTLKSRFLSHNFDYLAPTFISN